MRGVDVLSAEHGYRRCRCDAGLAEELHERCGIGGGDLLTVGREQPVADHRLEVAAAVVVARSEVRDGGVDLDR